MTHAEPELKPALEEMLYELQSHHLQVMLVPQRRFTNEGGMIRVACEKNVKWYRNLCGAYSSSRVRKNSAPDTKIKRANIERILVRLQSGASRSQYAADLVNIARGKLKRDNSFGNMKKCA